MIFVLAIFSFVTSYAIFYKLTSRVDTKIIKNSKPIEVKENTSEDGEKVIKIGEGSGEIPSPEPTQVTVTPDAGKSTQPTVTATPSIMPTATPTVSVSAVPSVQPSSAKPMVSLSVINSPTPLPSIAPIQKIKSVYFKVRVGSFDSRSEAEIKTKELEGMGYQTVIMEEPEGNYIQLGSFKEQEKALGLAEEISQKGYAVIIRQIEE